MKIISSILAYGTLKLSDSVEMKSILQVQLKGSSQMRV